MISPRYTQASIALLSLLFLGACSTVNLDPTGQNQAVFVAGEFRALVNASAPVAAKATSDAFRQLGLFQIKSVQRTFDAELAARTPKDEKLRVVIKEINSRQTEIDIRLEVGGNKNFSRALYDQIEKNIGGGMTAAPSSGGGY